LHFLRSFLRLLLRLRRILFCVFKLRLQFLHLFLHLLHLLFQHPDLLLDAGRFRISRPCAGGRGEQGNAKNNNKGL